MVASEQFVRGALSFKGEKTKKSKKKKSHETKHKLMDLAKKDNNNHHQQSSSVATTRTTETTKNSVALSESVVAVSVGTDDRTEAERKAWKRRMERERIILEQQAQKSHREQVEEFNEKLSTQTEHNDIPRISAAGNG